MYRERPSRIDGAVVWTRSSTDLEELRVLPDGCMDLIWSSAGRLFVAGPDRVAQLYVSQPGTTLTGLRFAPGQAPLVLGVPADALVNRRVALADLWGPADVRRIEDELAEAARPAHVLEALGWDALRDPKPGSAVSQVVRLLRDGHGVRQVADAVGLSERQLRRRSLEAFGYGPKTLARILRAQRAIDLARTGDALAGVAADAGYADQAHLARDIRALAGVPLTRLRD